MSSILCDVSIICISCLQCTCVHTALSEGFFEGVPAPHEVLSLPVLHLYLALFSHPSEALPTLKGGTQRHPTWGQSVAQLAPALADQLPANPGQPAVGQP